MKELRKFLSLWLVLCAATLPYDYHLLPNLGVGLSHLLSYLSIPIASWFGVDVAHSYLVSDSLAFYINGCILLFIAAIVYWLKQRFFPTISLLAVGNSILLVFLSFFLVYYGLDKLFQAQFYQPSGNILHSRLGQLDKDILFWTSMGTSKTYNIFMGGIEVLAGTLIVFDRCRFVGLLLSIGIFVNVLAINIGFDITVKYLTGLLLAISIFLILNYRQQLSILFGLSNMDNRNIQYLISNKWLLLLFVPVLLELFSAFKNLDIRGQGQSFEVVQTLDADDDFWSDVNRIHLHDASYFILERSNNKMYSYPMGPGKSSVKLDRAFIPFSIVGGTFNIDGNARLKVKEIDLSKLPLMQDKTTIYFEEMHKKGHSIE